MTLCQHQQIERAMFGVSVYREQEMPHRDSRKGTAVGQCTLGSSIAVEKAFKLHTVGMWEEGSLGRGEQLGLNFCCHWFRCL